MPAHATREPSTQTLVLFVSLILRGAVPPAPLLHKRLTRTIRRQAHGDVGIDRRVILFTRELPHAPAHVTHHPIIGGVGRQIRQLVGVAAQVVQLVVVKAVEDVLVIGRQHRALRVVELDPVALCVDQHRP